MKLGHFSWREIARKNIFYRWKSLKSHKGIPYTHRWESGNDTFQNTLHIFTGLENAFTGPGWTWKYHKSKDQKNLHPNYISKKKSQLREKIFFARSKIFRFFFQKFLVRKILSAKSKKSKCWNFKIFEISKFQHFDFFSILRTKIFRTENILKKNRNFFFDRAKKYFFSELRFFFGYSLDVKFSDLLIYDTSRSIRAR